LKQQGEHLLTLLSAIRFLKPANPVMPLMLCVRVITHVGVDSCF